MFFGTRDSFEYLECNQCGCLQIVQIPNNMNKYYSSDKYYSFQKRTKVSDYKKFFQKKRNQYLLLNNDFLGRLINIFLPYPFFQLLGTLNLDQNSRILDVGCGSNSFLYLLDDLKFNNLIGIDPYINNENHTKNLEILKKDIFELEDSPKFDLIILNHSIEHMSEHLKVMNKIEAILSKTGTCIILMPVKTNYIWDLYKTNWVQIDAPRHFLIHTIKSFDFLLEKTNLYIKKVIFDSNEFQFWGSEQYKKDIALYDKDSYLINPKKSIFKKTDIDEFKKRSIDLNKNSLGDQAIFILKKSSN